MKCVNCKTPVRSGTAEEVVTIGPLTFTVIAPAQVCPTCGENYLDTDTLGQIERAVAGALARDGVATSEAFRFMRKVIGLRARDVAELFGVTPETVSRWENGERPPAGEAVRLLAVLVNDHLAGRTDSLDLLRARRADADLPSARRIVLSPQLSF